MPQVERTFLATRQAGGMRGRVLAAYERWEVDLAARGCAAMGYRLSGQVFETLCAVHFAANWRALVAFGEDLATIVLIGRHDDRSPHNVYDLLYQLVGHEPEPASGRSKPSCCDPDTAQPPEQDQALVDNLSRRVRDLLS